MHPPLQAVHKKAPVNCPTGAFFFAASTPDEWRSGVHLAEETPKMARARTSRALRNERSPTLDIEKAGKSGVMSVPA